MMQGLLSRTVLGADKVDRQGLDCTSGPQKHTTKASRQAPCHLRLSLSFEDKTERREGGVERKKDRRKALGG